MNGGGLVIAGKGFVRCERCWGRGSVAATDNAATLEPILRKICPVCRGTGTIRSTE